MNSKNIGKVAVLMGGFHAEREISLRSGAAALRALQNKNIDVVGIDVTRDLDLVQELSAHSIDRVFLALHGTWGEDGTVQALLDEIKMPYTGSGVAASALCMDKFRIKTLWKNLNIPTPEFEVIASGFDPEAIIKKLGLPLFVKPANEGSSLGISKVTNAEELVQAQITASEYDDTVIVESFINGPEYTVGIINDTALPVIQIKTPREFYDYEAKYFTDTTEYCLPSGLSEKDEKRLQKLALETFNAVDCRHWGRVDAMQDSAGNFYILEINTIPGLTDHSLVPMAAKDMGIAFDDLVMKILGMTCPDQ